MFQKVASFTKVLPCLMPKKACGTSYFSFSPLPLPFSIYVCVSKLKKFIQAEHYLMPPEFFIFLLARKFFRCTKKCAAIFQFL